MNEEWWESSTCFVCDYWWVFLIVIVMAITAYFTQDFWLPALLAAMGV